MNICFYTDFLFIHSKVVKGTIMLDSSTIDPAVSQDMAKVAEGKGAFYLDAPVSGGKNIYMLVHALLNTGFICLPSYFHGFYRLNFHAVLNFPIAYQYIVLMCKKQQVKPTTEINTYNMYMEIIDTFTKCTLCNFLWKILFGSD